MSVTVRDRPDRRCGATNRQGKRCGNWAIRGARVCRMHGGALKKTRVAAARRVAEAQAFEALSRYTSEPVTNPLAEFARLAGEIVRLKDWLGSAVEKLQEMRYPGRSGEQIRGELQAYANVLDMCRRVLADYGRLNVDERLARVEERQVQLVFGLQAAALERIGIPRVGSGGASGLSRAVYAFMVQQLRGLPPSPELDAELDALRARLTVPDRTAQLEATIERLRAEHEAELRLARSELDAVVGQRDELLDALRRNRSRPVLELEAATPPEVVVEGDTVRVPDDVPVVAASSDQPSSARSFSVTWPEASEDW